MNFLRLLPPRLQAPRLHAAPSLAAALLGAALILGGCGGDQPGAFALPTATPAPTDTGTANTGTAGAGAGNAAAGLAPPPAGGTINLTLNAEPDSLNPILENGNAGEYVNRLLFPALVGRNPYTGVFGPDNAMAQSYEVSPDGLTYTFTLRPGALWSDGEPLDAADFKFTYDAILSEQVESPFKTSLANLAGIDVLDPLRVQVRFQQPFCDAIEALRIPWLPSHLYAPDFTDIMASQGNTNPPVTAGPFAFQSWTPGENIVLRRNARAWQGAPLADRVVLHIEADQTERFARLLDGGVDVAPVAPSQMTSAEADPNVLIYRANLDGYDFVAINLANPKNPQPGVDEAGNRLVQDPHPVLADRSVRQAMALALDYDTIIESIYLQQGYRITSNVLPIIPWAHDVAVEPYLYDPNAARQLLESGGWIDTNNDGIRERGQTPLVLELIVVAGNTIHEQLADLVQDQLNSVGFDITVTPLEATALAAQLLGQRYDLAVTGWTGLGSDPNDDWLWASSHDRPASDFNFVSYQNPEVDRLLAEANRVPGCRPQDRAPLYKQIQQLIRDDLPYIFISGAVGNTGYRQDLGGIEPAAWDFTWNLYDWYRTAPEP